MTCNADAGASDVHLQLLGRWNLSAPEGLLGVSADRTSQKLLALLALRGPLSRPQIWGSLWPDATTAHASGRLRTAVWRLAASRFLLLDASPAQMSLAHNVHVDVTDFYSAAAALDGGLNHTAGHTDISLFCADLLPEWDEEWLMGDRERIRQLRLHTLEALSAQLLQERRFGAAIEAALAAVGSDPLRESAQRAVICAHLAQGNTAAALGQFKSCQALYARELKTAPSGALYALVSPLMTDKHWRI